MGAERSEASGGRAYGEGRRSVRRARDAAALVALPALVLQATAVPAGAADDAPLGVAVTAAGSLVRTHGWTIDQSVDAVARSVDVTGRATFRWTVTARAGDVTDSAWALAGDVTVTNPAADGDVVADVAVTTDLGGDAACTVAGGDDAVVPAAGSLTLAWTCAFSSAPSASGSVSATASWAPDAHATGTAPAELVVVEPDRTVAVVGDHAVPGQRVVLDPALTWAPGLVRSWTYDLALAGGAPSACATYVNSASVDLASGADPVVHDRRPLVHARGAAGAGLRLAGGLGARQVPRQGPGPARQPVGGDRGLQAPRRRQGAPHLRAVVGQQALRHPGTRAGAGDPEGRLRPARPDPRAAALRRPPHRPLAHAGRPVVKHRLVSG